MTYTENFSTTANLVRGGVLCSHADLDAVEVDQQQQHLAVKGNGWQQNIHTHAYN